MDEILQRLGVDESQIRTFCEKWKIVRFELFGSVLRDDFDAQSDIDVLVTFAADGRAGLHELLDIEEELQRMFGRNVDVVKRHLVESSPNYIRRRRILESARPIYATSG